MLSQPLFTLVAYFEFVKTVAIKVTSTHTTPFCYLQLYKAECH